jgi:hypothetical protein
MAKNVPNCAADMVVRPPTHAAIAARAYQIYLERGCQPWHDIDDWVQAEYELMQLPIRKLAEMEPPKDLLRRGRRRSIIELVRTVLC